MSTWPSKEGTLLNVVPCAVMRALGWVLVAIGVVLAISSFVITAIAPGPNPWPEGLRKSSSERGAFKALPNRGSQGRTKHIRRQGHDTAELAAGPAVEAARSRQRAG